MPGSVLWAAPARLEEGVGDMELNYLRAFVPLKYLC